MDRRNLLLNEMGITRWQLYRPEVLQGAVGVCVSEQVKFIVVTNDNLSSSPLRTPHFFQMFDFHLS